MTLYCEIRALICFIGKIIMSIWKQKFMTRISIVLYKVIVVSLRGKSIYFNLRLCFKK
jgi:uncharacterized membrane protein YeiH